MSKLTERLERLLLFTVLGFMYLGPQIFYIRPFEEQFARVLAPVLAVTSVLSIMYAIFCLCFRGFVEAAAATAGVPGEGHYSTRSCTICMQPKPERAHHCSRCKKCIKKMDHHCHWLGRCINYDNLGHFVRFLLFTFLSMSMLMIFNIYYIYHAIRYNEMIIPRSIAALVTATTLISGLLILVTGIHFFAQMKMVLHNITFIEKMKKRGLSYPHKCSYNSPFDIGWYENLLDVFGPAYFLFLWMPRGDGMSFKKRNDVEDSVGCTGYYEEI